MFHLRVLLAGLLALAASAVAEEAAVVHVYNWSDYIAEEVLERFTARTGIEVVYDVYDANEVLEAKLLAGHSGYDVVFPTDKPFAQQHIKAGLYRSLERDRLPHYANLDPDILAALSEDVDPGNAHVVPYMWGTTGLGYNRDKLRVALGEDVPADTWGLIFDPRYASKLADCGISVMDDETEAIGAALLYLGKRPDSTDPKDLEAVVALFDRVRPYITYFHSSKYINDLANGDLCLAQGYSGDVLQARDRAEEAGNGVDIAYAIPAEGALIWTDVMAIPADAPHPQAAHAFIDFLLEPEVIAACTNYVAYANANPAAYPLVNEAIRTDPGIYPPPEVKQRLVSAKLLPPKAQRLRVRTWNRIKTGR